MSWSATTTFATVLDEFYLSGFDYIEDNSNSDRAKRWVNQAYQELCSLENWPWLRSTATGAAPLAVTDLGQATSVVDTVMKMRLDEADEDQLADVDPDYVTTSGPGAYYYISQVAGVPTVYTYPVSTNSLLVTYTKTPTELSADADVLVVPNQYIDVVVMMAMLKGMIDGTDTRDQYQLVTAQLQSRLDSMRKALAPKTYQRITFASEDW